MGDYCVKCGNDHYILQGCCSGYMCDCMGKPSLMINCTSCNPNGDKPIGESVKPWCHYVEYIKQERPNDN